MALRILGAVLIVGAIGTSIFSLAPAGFMFVTGLIAIAAGVFRAEQLVSVNVSPTGLSLQLQQAEQRVGKRIEQAGSMLDRIEEVDDRLLVIASELLLNKGGDNYFSILGDEATFELYQTLRAGLTDASSEKAKANLKALKRRVALSLVWALIGEEDAEFGDGHIMEHLRDGDFLELPSAHVLQKLAIKDEIDISRYSYIIEAYDCVLNGKHVPASTTRLLAEARTRIGSNAESWEDETAALSPVVKS